MDQREIIFSKLSKLPEEKQNEVIDFIEFLTAKNTDVQLPDENKDWSEFSLSQAMKGMEDEPDLYTAKDIKFKF